MDWFYVDDGKQAGSVSDIQLDELVCAGRVRSETLVWREGLANWTVYSAVMALVAAVMLGALPVAGAAALSGMLCCECGQTFPFDQVIRYGDRFVCAICKPVFLQRLAEGAPLASPVGSLVMEAQLFSREYWVEIGESLNRVWRLFIANPGLVFGVTVLCGIIYVVGYVVSMVVGMVIPLANMFLSLLYTIPLMGGYLFFFLRLARGEQASVGDAMAGFLQKFGQLVLLTLVQTLIFIVCLLPVIIAAVVMGFLVASMRGQNPHFAVGMIAVLAVLGLLALCALAYLGTLWTHSVLLVMDKNYSFWLAMWLSAVMVKKGWWMTFLFLLVAGIISFLGFLALCVGLFVSVPFYFAMRVFFYDDNFCDLMP